MHQQNNYFDDKQVTFDFNKALSSESLMDSYGPERSIDMEIEIVKDFTGCPDGITSVNYTKGDKIEVSKEFADIVIASGNAKHIQIKEKKVVEVKETKKTKKE